ncbi:unnamed protein product [Rotaria sp. Silwood1]|nr:unnamed protein product [Rotaria sp. Silwood1]
MSSNGNSDMNKILVTKDKDEDDGKYLILLVYLLEENGCCGGGYHEKSLSIHGGVSGQSFNEMLEQAYESLEVAMKEEDRIPFDINDIKKSVKFDCVKCSTTDEMDMVYKLNKQGKTFKEIKEQIKQ